jgi:hypothetical protein
MNPNLRWLVYIELGAIGGLFSLFPCRVGYPYSAAASLNSVQSDQQRNLTMWQKNQNFIKASFRRGLCRTRSGSRNPENCQVTPTAQPNLQAVHGFGQAQSHTKFHTSGSRWPKKTASLIKKETLWFGSEIGRCWVSHFAISPARCRLGRVQRNPTKLGVSSTQPTKYKV